MLVLSHFRYSPLCAGVGGEREEKSEKERGEGRGRDEFDFCDIKLSSLSRTCRKLSPYTCFCLLTNVGLNQALMRTG